MSEAWIPYLQMVTTKCPGAADHAGIFGQDGSPWIDQGTNATPAEVQTLCAAFDDASQIQANGFTLGGMKFVFARIDTEENFLLGKSKKENDVCPGGPCSVMKTKSALIIAYGNTDVPAGVLNIAVSGLGEYLVSSNY